MWRWLAMFLGAALLAAALVAWAPRLLQRVEAPILVGLVHSRTGPLASVESPMLDAEVLALEEINEAGGLMGRRVTWEIADGRSEPQEFGREARRLLEAEKAVVLFGGTTSPCRRAMEAAAASAKRLVSCAGASEGMEVLTDVVGTGPLPNQLAVPAVSWCLDELKARKVFLAGSADVFSYAVSAVAREQVQALGAAVVGEAYAEIDGSGMPELVAAVKSSGADVVVSSIVGDSNQDFFRQMAAAGLTAETLPVVSLRLGEDDLRQIPAADVAGHYAGAAYFQSLADEVNRRFVEKFKARFGADRPTSDAVASAYFGVKLWAQAVEEAGTVETGEVGEHLRRQSMESGEGVVAVDYEMVHAWRPFRIGKVRRDGQFDVVWSLPRPIRPVAFPIFRSRATWEAALRRWREDGEPGLDAPAPPPSTAPEPLPEAAPAAKPASARARTAPAPVVWGPRGAVRPGDGPRPASPSPLRSAASPRPGVR